MFDLVQRWEKAANQNRCIADFSEYQLARMGGPGHEDLKRFGPDRPGPSPPGQRIFTIWTFFLSLIPLCMTLVNCYDHVTTFFCLSIDTKPGKGVG